MEVLESTAAFPGESREILARPVPLTRHRPASDSDKLKGQIILIPGWSGPRSGPADLLVFLASRFANSGWEAIRIDLPGRGDAPGEFGASGLDEMISAAAATLQAHAKGPAARRFIVGLCSGGNVALGVPGVLDGALKQTGVVTLSTLPFQPSRSKKFEDRKRWKKIKQYGAKLLSPNTWVRLVRGEINVDRVKKNMSAAGKPSGSSDRNLKDSKRDIEADLRGWNGAGLFIWGGGDEEAALAREYFETLHANGMGSREGTEFHTVAGANHNYYGKAWREELSDRILRFIERD